MEAGDDGKHGSEHQRLLLQVGSYVGIAVALALFAAALIVPLRPTILMAIVAFALWAAVYVAFALAAHMPRTWWRAKWRDPLEVLGILAPDEDPLEKLRRPPRA